MAVCVYPDMEATRCTLGLPEPTMPIFVFFRTRFYAATSLIREIRAIRG